jgi:4'-phosphopantetheinyl transferase
VHVWRLRYDRAQGRAPLRAVLAAYLGVPPARVELAAGPHGRPVLAAGLDDALGFNWSHSGAQAFLAVARGLAPGIDLERVRPRPHALEIARRYFAPAEADWLAALPDAARDAASLRLWTAKEAVLKALGRGLAFGLHRLEIGLDDGTPRLRRLESQRPADWQLHAVPADDGHVAALAWHGGPRRIVLRPLAGP